MTDETTLRWKRLFQKNCTHWDDANKRRYINVVNDPEEIDEIELQSAIDLITDINGKPPLE